MQVISFDKEDVEAVGIMVVPLKQGAPRRLYMLRPLRLSSGIARLLSIGGTFDPLYVPRRLSFPSDTEAFAVDWRAIGDDLRKAMRSIEMERSNDNATAASADTR